jgi:hypothetical protein
MTTKDQYIRALRNQAAILEDYAEIIRTMADDDDHGDIAEHAVMRAHSAYRAAIGAHCTDCGGNTEQHVGNS